MMRVFDYVFFKVSKTYFKFDGRTGATGIAAVTIVQSLFLCDIFFFLIRISEVGDLSNHRKQIGAISFVVILALFFFNIYYYKDKYNRLKNLWKSETELQATMGSIFVFCLIIIPFVLAFFIVNN